jgi:hypothetical protein
MISGLLGTVDDLFRSRPVRRLTAMEQRHEAEELDRFVSRAVAREQQEQSELDESEINLLVRDALERKYRDYIVARSSVSESTHKQYLASCKKFHEFCREVGARELPALAGLVASFLHTELTNGASASTIRRHAAALSYFHRLNEEHDPTDDELVRAVVYASTQKAKELDEDSH